MLLDGLHSVVFLDQITVVGYGPSICFDKTPGFVWTSLLHWKVSPRFPQDGMKHLPTPAEDGCVLLTPVLCVFKEGGPGFLVLFLNC